MTETRTLSDEDIRTLREQPTSAQAAVDDDGDDTDTTDTTDSADTTDTTDTDDDGTDA